MAYKFPVEGQLLPPMSNYDVDGNQIFENGTSTQQDKCNRFLQASWQDKAFIQNRVRAEDYTNYMVSSWIPNYQSGKVDKSIPPPNPPDEYWVGTDYDGWMFITFTLVPLGGHPVCEIPKYK